MEGGREDFLQLIRPSVMDPGTKSYIVFFLVAMIFVLIVCSQPFDLFFYFEVNIFSFEFGPSGNVLSQPDNLHIL